MIATTPLTHPHVDRHAGFAEASGAAGAEEIERRAQELLNEWFARYFSGVEFLTPVNDVLEPMSLLACDILWDMATPERPLEKPVLHLQLVDRVDGEGMLVAKNKWRHDGKWTWNLLVRVPVQLPAAVGASVEREPATVASGRICRKAADQARWLLNSGHLQELAAKGVGHLRVVNGPRQIPAGSWQLRQIVFTADVTYHRLSNMP